jgi:microcystin-dependent protein
MATIMIFAGNFAPGGWNFCDGSLQSIANFSALFSLIGTTYGGDGQTTFGLPDLRGRVPVASNNGATGPGLTAIQLGESGGSTQVTLTSTNLPAHQHPVTVDMLSANAPQDGSNAPTGILAIAARNIYTNPALADGKLNGVNAGNVLPAGSSAPFSIMQPYLALNYVICMEGIYPSRN